MKHYPHNPAFPPPRLDPDEPGLDEDTRERRRLLIELKQMSLDEVFQIAVRAGIYTRDGKLTRYYGGDGEAEEGEATSSSSRLPVESARLDEGSAPPERRCPHCNGPIT